MVKKKSIFPLTKLSDVVSMKSGESITAERITSEGKFPCFGGNGLRGYTTTFTHDGSYTLVGRQGALCGNVTFVSGRFYASEHAIVVTPKKETDIKFMSYVLYDMNLNQYSESSAQPGLSVKKLLELEYPIPQNKEEQTAIAEALSDIDGLISSLKKLIEKKKAIKQGAMQELLTGKKRLPGFSGEWKKERLGDISDIKDGTHGTFQRVDRGYPLLSAKNVYNNHLDIAENESLISSEDYYSIIANGFPRKGDILLSCVGTIGRCCIYSGMPKVAFQRSVAFIRVKECVASYILQYMQSENANKQLLNSANASAQAGVYLGAISDIEVYMPCCVKEQQAIAQVLSDMDSEIEQQEKKLAKYQQIKQGMMQELLTGRIRLV